MLWRGLNWTLEWDSREGGEAGEQGTKPRSDEATKGWMNKRIAEWGQSISMSEALERVIEGSRDRGRVGGECSGLVGNGEFGMRNSERERVTT